MIWRPCTPADEAAVLRLTREPMAGRIRLAWGLDQLRCPPECDRLRTYVVEDEGRVVACAMAWDWPGGQRYLSGLRFAPDFHRRPRPAFWRRAFETLLDGAGHAWTSIGKTNRRARRLLESGASWLPGYIPRQPLTTWFIPLARHRRRADPSTDLDLELGVEPLSWRHAEIVAGDGAAYRTGRLLDAFGLPGVPTPGRPMRLAEFQPRADACASSIRRRLRAARGHDGLVVVLPDGTARARHFREAAPWLAWTWHSTLFSVVTDRNSPLPEIPDWKGAWL